MAYVPHYLPHYEGGTSGHTQRAAGGVPEGDDASWAGVEGVAGELGDVAEAVGRSLKSVAPGSAASETVSASIFQNERVHFRDVRLVQQVSHLSRLVQFENEMLERQAVNAFVAIVIDLSSETNGIGRGGDMLSAAVDVLSRSVPLGVDVGLATARSRCTSNSAAGIEEGRQS